MPPTTVITNPGSVRSDKHALDQHVEDVLSRKDKFRRTIQGLWAYLKTPIGILTGEVLPHSFSRVLIGVARHLRLSCGVLGRRDRTFPR